MEIKKAVKKKQKLRVALTGVSGSGKTKSSLILAFSMGCKKICVIDTERGSASLYSGKDCGFQEYDVLELDPPYSSDRYIQAITLAENGGYDCIIIDSLSHEWSMEGGCLSAVSNISSSSRSGNSYTAWNKVTPKHDMLISKIVTSKCHIIATMRSKTAYDKTIDEKGKMKPVKIGVAPIQREGVEFEFTNVFELDLNHNFICTKDRTGLFNNIDIPIPFDEQVGKKMVDWLNDGQEKEGNVKYRENNQIGNDSYNIDSKKQEIIDMYADMIGAAKDDEELSEIGGKLKYDKNLSDEDKEPLRLVFSSRKQSF